MEKTHALAHTHVQSEHVTRHRNKMIIQYKTPQHCEHQK